MATVTVATEVQNRAKLAGLRVLVTRPRQQAAHWQRLLQAEGAATVALPLLEIEPINEDCTAEYHAIKTCIQNLDHYQHAIFVSQNAAHFGAQWIDRYWPQLPLGLAFYAVGTATAAVLRRAGFDVTAADSSMNSEELLQLPQLQKVAQQRVLIFRGVGGRPRLAQELTLRGARVDYCELYRRQIPDDAGALLRALVSCQPGDVISVHSGETLNNLWRLVSQLGKDGILNPDQWLQVPLLVPGERVQAQAAATGFHHVITAANASDLCMLEALLSWRNIE